MPPTLYMILPQVAYGQLGLLSEQLGYMRTDVIRLALEFCKQARRSPLCEQFHVGEFAPLAGMRFPDQKVP